MLSPKRILHEAGQKRCYCIYIEGGVLAESEKRIAGTAFKYKQSAY